MAVWTVSFGSIIAVEAATGLFFLIGAAALWRARDASTEVFNRAKKWVHVGATMAMLLWFLGFMMVGGEWFLMWQSPTWNGQDNAFKFYMSVLAVLIYVNQND